MSIYPAFRTAEAGVAVAIARRCHWAECDEPLPELPGREGQNLYCCREHRTAAHRRRIDTRLRRASSAATT